MKQNQLRQLVKEIVSQTMQEIQKPRADWSVNGNVATVENVELEDGRIVGGDFELQLSRGNSGIGSYEFWGQKGYDRGTDYVGLEGWNLVRAWIENASGQDQPFNIKDPNNKPLIDALEIAMETNQQNIEQYIGNNPPEPYTPEREDIPGSDR